MSSGRPKIYNTDEERLDAKRKRAREWAYKFRKSETYQERISKMNQEEYIEFLKRENERKKLKRNILKKN